MLTELHIENFAIIEKLDLQMGSGLVTFTGETGAGKSIILDAIEMMLGGRAEIDSIRTGAERASVEGTFRMTGLIRPHIQTLLEQEDLIEDPDYIILRREIRREGRSIARINGRAVNNNLLREVGSFLVDIHGQSDHLSLLNPRQHIGLLDRYANTGFLLIPYSEAYQRLKSIRQELETLRQSETEATQRTDLLNYQVQEIETARLQPGEEEELVETRNRLANSENLADLTLEALQLLDESSPEAACITDLLGQVTRALTSISRIDPTKSTLLEQAEASLENLADLTRDLRTYQESIEFNPKRLEQIEDRLALIHNLKRKYGSSIEAIIAFAADARQQLDKITHASERIAELETEEKDLLQKLSTLGQDLSQKRRQAAADLGRAMERELGELRMEGARFEVDFQYTPDQQGALLADGQKVAIEANGLDHIEFLLAPNPGEGLKPLAKIASGGETSRLMLALKNVLAKADPVPTLIFDEIDQGIGGRVGVVVGYKLWKLARQHQVFCVTHLPQLAAFSEQHFRVKKQVENERTITEVEILDGEARTRELAQMMGAISEGTLRSANEILQAADHVKKTSQSHGNHINSE